ncbi:MAG: hypothetical protein ACOCUD_03685 [Bacillota bacterium]
MVISNLVWSFELDGTEIKDYVLEGTKIEISRHSKYGNSAIVVLSDNILDTYSVEAGQTVVIKRGVSSADTVIFRGKIKDIKDDENNTFSIILKDKINELKHLLFTKSYDKNIDTENGNYSEIFKSIVEDGGFTASVEDSSSTNLEADKFISRQEYRLDKMNVIATILNWYFYEDYVNDWIKLEPKGFTSYGTTLTVGDNVINIPDWETDIEVMRNRITINGAYNEGVREDSFTATASQTEFTLNYTPESTEVTVDGTLKLRGVPNSTETYDYYVDRELKKVIFINALTGGETVTIKYVGLIPTPVTGFSQSSFTKYNVWHDEAFKFEDVVTISDAKHRLNQLLEILKDGEIKTTLNTTEYNIKVGQKVQVSDPYNTDKDGEYVVFKKVINYPEPIDSITIGNLKYNLQDLFDAIKERLKALEKEDPSLVDLLLHLFSLNTSIGITNTSFILSARNKICDSFIVGHYVNGLFGMGTTLDNFESSNSSNWSGTSFTVSDENTIKLVSNNSIKLVWAGGDSTGNLLSTQSFGDISNYTGVNSGTPSQGTVGLWVYVTTATDIEEINLKLGSSASDYIEMSALAYASVNGYSNWNNLSFTLQEGWNYLLFDLDNGTKTGNPDWTSCEYALFEINFSGNATIYFDYFTISKSNYIGLNGFGTRKMVIN